MGTEYQVGAEYNEQLDDAKAFHRNHSLGGGLGGSMLLFYVTMRNARYGIILNTNKAILKKTMPA